MTSLPTRLTDVRKLLQTLEWDKLSLAVEEEAHARLAIVGPVNSGKSTLFNLIKGRKVSAVKAVPGTTKGLVTEEIGPFVLVDTPGFGEVGSPPGNADRSILMNRIVSRGTQRSPSNRQQLQSQLSPHSAGGSRIWISVSVLWHLTSSARPTRAT